MVLPLFIKRILQPAAPVASLVASHKSEAEAALTVAIQRANSTHAALEREFKQAAHEEFVAIQRTVENAHKRVQAIIDTGALPDTTVPAAILTRENLARAPKRDTQT